MGYLIIFSNDVFILAHVLGITRNVLPVWLLTDKRSTHIVDSSLPNLMITAICFHVCYHAVYITNRERRKKI